MDHIFSGTIVDKLNWLHLSGEGTTHNCGDLPFVIMTGNWYPFPALLFMVHYALGTRSILV